MTITVTGDFELPANKDAIEHALAAFWRALRESVPSLQNTVVAAPRKMTVVSRGSPFMQLADTAPQASLNEEQYLLFVVDVARGRV